MKFISTRFKDVYVIELEFFGDERGGFMRTYDLKLFQEIIPSFSGQWKQMNHSFNLHKRTFRGLHYQEAPYQEAKCVRCISGAVIDFALDLRENSETFLQVFEVELSAINQKMIYLPKGFAHGFYTIEDNSELVYLHDEFYQPDFDRGVYYEDELIKTKINISPIVISEKDKCYKRIENQFKGI